MMCARTESEVRQAAEEIRAKTGSEVLAMAADVTRADDIKALAARTQQAFGGVDILVANCGGPPRGNLDEMTDEQWYGAFEVATLSVVRLIRGVLPPMKQKRWGRILTIQSVSVKQPVPGLLLSNAVRPGVAGMVKTLAEDLGKHNITINVVCPGKILTDRLLGGAKQAGLAREEFLEKAGLDIPLGRVGTPEEFANVMVFLASERASYVTGVALQVDGGLIRSNV
jgi:3-oxoacyl-[acyl-carrier protein] reductase